MPPARAGDIKETPARANINALALGGSEVFVRHLEKEAIKGITATKEKSNLINIRLLIAEIRQLPILPCSVPQSTFGVNELNFCVRNGYRWVLVAIVTGMAILRP